ncbi:MAG: 4Fe-4S dicluster domain-containing protein [Desulfobacterales bacterium]|nr:4Fe-4S dicluster domain-containing protein [Desulfobacterales bacterium]
MDLQNLIKEKGVVGAGGAGFPTHVKVGSSAHTVLVNAAECEPLLHKDKQLLFHRTGAFFKGLEMVMAGVQAQKGIIGIKKKHTALIDMLESSLPANVDICRVDDFYPAGDEITLIRETTGTIVPPGELPISRGIVVNNVESLVNIGTDGPVTTKFINLAGDVENRHTLEVPLGVSFADLLAYAKPTLSDYAVIEGGPMMGSIVTDMESVVTKTTAALIVLPKDHVLIRKYTDMASEERVNRIGKAACDQCTFCTELCPRYLLGHPIQPHRAMRSLVFHHSGDQPARPETHALYCCQCNLCSFVSCPEGLYPSQVCINNRKQALAQKAEYEGPLSNQGHPLAQFRKTPSRRLKTMLDLNRFPDTGELTDHSISPESLTLKLQQHIGGPAGPVVSVGESVEKGQKIATMGDALGSEIHSSANGTVTRVDDTCIVITPSEQTN